MQRKSEDQLLKLGFKENQESYARLDLINATALHQLGVSAKTCFKDDLVNNSKCPIFRYSIAAMTKSNSGFQR